MKKILSLLASVGLVTTASTAVVSCRTIQPQPNYGVRDVKVSSPSTKDNSVIVSGKFFASVPNTINEKDLENLYTVTNSIRDDQKPASLRQMNNQPFAIEDVSIKMSFSNDKSKIGKAAPKTGTPKYVVVSLDIKFKTIVQTRSLIWNFSINQKVNGSNDEVNTICEFDANMPGYIPNIKPSNNK